MPQLNRQVQLVESQWIDIELNLGQASAISVLGKALASRESWWGDSGKEESERTVIACRPNRRGSWEVRVDNAIGAFGVEGITFTVVPKIAIKHVLYLLSKAAVVPRIDFQELGLSEGESFLEIIVRWFLDRVTEVVSQGLIRDYEEETGVVSAVRGHLDALATAERYYSGSLEVACRYDEFREDNAYNRLLLAALTRVQGLRLSNVNLRREAQRTSGHFPNTSSLRDADATVTLDRRSYYYRDAIALALLIIRAIEISLEAGMNRAWTFLIRTPEAIEDGIRTVLREGLSPAVAVEKRETRLLPSSLRIKPDLRFFPNGEVGDCKYKLYGRDWLRSDLYQSVAFAAGVRSARSCVIAFTEGGDSYPIDVVFGDISVTALLWDVSISEPQAAAAQMAQQCLAWLESPPGRLSLESGF